MAKQNPHTRAPIATIYIPYAPYHKHLVQRAIVSGLRQTVNCEVLSDLCLQSPAVYRNRAKMAKTPFVVFLDADDVLHPRFVEACLGAYQEGRYVYTSWYEGDYVHKPRACAWSSNSHHIVTTLYPTAIFNALGGFDETMPGHEDADFYMRSYAHRICGIHLDEPLVVRPEDSGQRSRDFHAHPDYQLIMSETVRKNGGLINIMACCGAEGAQVQHPLGAILPGDVIAETLWMGMRSENGQASGRMYIGGNGTKVSIDPKDVAAAPHLFRMVQDMRELAPKRERVLKDSGLT
jgi:hypothetical protein